MEGLTVMVLGGTTIPRIVSPMVDWGGGWGGIIHSLSYPQLPGVDVYKYDTMTIRRRPNKKRARFHVSDTTANLD